MHRVLFQRTKHQQLLQHFRLTRFSDFTGKEHLVDDAVNLVEVEHQIKLAHVVEVFVKNLNKVVNGFQVAQVVVVDIDADAEVQTCVPAVHDLEVAELNKVRVFCIPNGNNCVNFFNQLLLLIIIEIHVPFR